MNYVLPAWLPHLIQLCIHCRERPAGFWVSQVDVKTVRRPWCLSCCTALDRDYRVIPFDAALSERDQLAGQYGNDPGTVAA